MRKTAENAAGIGRLERTLKALADPTRLRVLALIGENEVCVCHIHTSLRLPQSTVSRHLAYLRRAGLVETRRDAVWMHYRTSDALEPAIRGIVQAAIAAARKDPVSTKDRTHFQRAFGRLYVFDSPSGGTCCAPRG